jgi:hypothetical protein
MNSLQKAGKSKSSKTKKGGNFLGAVGDLVAPTGWGSFATAAALVGIDQADSALRRRKSEKSSAKKGGMYHPPPIPRTPENNGWYIFNPGLINNKINHPESKYETIAFYKNINNNGKNILREMRIPENMYKRIKKNYRIIMIEKKIPIQADQYNINSPERKFFWDKIIIPIYRKILDQKIVPNQENIRKIIINSKNNTIKP